MWLKSSLLLRQIHTNLCLIQLLIPDTLPWILPVHIDLQHMNILSLFRDIDLWFITGSTSTQTHAFPLAVSISTIFGSFILRAHLIQQDWKDKVHPLKCKRFKSYISVFHIITKKATVLVVRRWCCFMFAGSDCQAKWQRRPPEMCPGSIKIIPTPPPTLPILLFWSVRSWTSVRWVESMERSQCQYVRSI